jgi:ribosome-binding protein aMBF1 (putative translation factor)
MQVAHRPRCPFRTMKRLKDQDRSGQTDYDNAARRRERGSPRSPRRSTPRSPEVSVNQRRSPTIRRRRLGAELRRHRDAAGVTIDVVADRLGCSASKVSRIETGHTSATPRDVQDMLDIYGVAGTESEELV